MEHEPVNSVKPQIKQPKVSPTKNLKTPLKQNEDARTSSNSSYDESAQSSPSILDDKGEFILLFFNFYFKRRINQLHDLVV